MGSSSGVRVLVACDSFKDSLNANLVNQSIRNGILKCLGRIAGESQLNNGGCAPVIKTLSLSDGGEGFVESLVKQMGLSLHTFGGKEEVYRITGPQGAPLVGANGGDCGTLSSPVVSYGYVDGEQSSSDDSAESESSLAVIEMATASGLELVPEGERDAFEMTSRGFGEMIWHAFETYKCRRFLLGVGGSATNDAGLGALQALGLDIHCKNNKVFTQNSKESFCGKDLLHVEKLVVTEKLQEFIEASQIQIACDVDNPFIGPRGAVHVFSKQKGVREKSARDALEEGMVITARVIEDQFGVRIQDMPGAGAAGGISGAFSAVLKANLRKGTDIICEALHLKDRIAESDLVVTGEGSYDSQTASGKVVACVQGLCMEYKKPCAVVCGRNGLKESGGDFQNVFDLLSMFSKEVAMTQTERCLEEMVEKEFEALLRQVETYRHSL
eukprot:Nk52_evm46s240 gene=Nk52_evmTU46s240